MRASVPPRRCICPNRGSSSKRCFRRAGSFGQIIEPMPRSARRLRVLAVKAAVGHHVARLPGRSMASMRSTLSAFSRLRLELLVHTAGNQRSVLPSFRQGTVRCRTRPSCPAATDNHIDVRFVGTEDFVRIVDLASDDPLVCLFDNLREQFEFSSIRARIRAACAVL